MNILDYIDLRWFLVSLSLGLLFCYCSVPTPKIVIKFPTPYTSDTSVFSDDVDNCYKFKTTEVSCSDATDIKTIPIQKTLEYFNNTKKYKK
tara:strand:+ start:488 stop:760 length:273 start_codon:yes stop_codon:yes gene_type:complete